MQEKPTGKNAIALFRNRAVSFYKAGNFKQSLLYYQKAIQAAHKAGDLKAEMQLLRAMARVYRALGDNAMADTCRAQAAAIAVDIKKHPPRRVRKNEKKGSAPIRRIETRRIRSFEGVTLGVPLSPEKKNCTVIKVFYATDRNDTGAQNPSVRFGVNRAKLSYGMCDVSIPRTHRTGKTESPVWWRFEFRPDPRKHIVLTRIFAQNKDAYFSDIKNLIQNSEKKAAFIFIHGFNTTFEDAARRTAQMAYDLEFKGAPVFYSWPSQDTLPGYMADENAVQWTEDHLKTFLSDMSEKSGAQNIYLIAHSMGNRALLRALTALMDEKPLLRAQIRELILAAPDVDAEVFKNQIAPWVARQASECVTLYASAHDTALEVSGNIHGGYPRAGDTGENIIVMPKIEIIDATRVDTDLFGHGYFSRAPKVLSDIRLLIDESKRASMRGLKRRRAPAGYYWVL
jgi:esterase/lipase superfamily enzyme